MRLEAEPAGNGRGIGHSSSRHVDAYVGRFGPEIQSGQEQRSRTGAEVENQPGSIRFVKMLKCRRDQDLAVRSRDQNPRPDVKLDVPEGAATSNIGDRLPCLSPLEHLAEALWHVAL